MKEERRFRKIYQKEIAVFKEKGTRGTYLQNSYGYLKTI
jgi:hypothetical protein